METEGPESSSQSRPGFLSTHIQDLRPAEAILAASVLTYSAGFIVSNMYLGSLGVLNLDILRVRYLTTGILFFVFLLTLFYPLHGIFAVFREHTSKPLRNLVSALGNRTWDRWGLIWLIALFLSGVVSYRNRPFPMPGQASNPQWAEWISTRAPHQLQEAGRFFLSLVILLGIVVVILALLIVVMNPKSETGERRGRLKVLGELAQTLVKGILSWRAMAWVVGLFLIVFAFDYLSYYANSQATVLSFRVDPAIGRFLLVPFLLYVLILMYVFVLFVGPRPEPLKSPPRAASDVAIIALLAGIVIPLYSLAVYPSLPQQIGGGRPIPVEVTFTWDGAPPQELDSPQHSTYMLDRSEDAIIFLILVPARNDFSVIEVPESSISSIRYIPPNP